MDGSTLWNRRGREKLKVIGFQNRDIKVLLVKTPHDAEYKGLGAVIPSDVAKSQSGPVVLKLPK